MKRTLATIVLFAALATSAFAQLAVKPVFDWTTGQVKHLYSLNLTEDKSLHSLDGEPVMVQRLDVTDDATPEVGTVYSFAWSSSGNAYSLTDIPIYTASVNLPFGLGFRAGHAAFYGQKMQGTAFVGNVFGYGLFAEKDLGGDGAFLRAALALLIGDRKSDLAFTAGFGWKFD